MKLTRIALAALTLSVAAACSSDVTGPTAATPAVENADLVNPYGPLPDLVNPYGPLPDLVNPYGPLP